MTLRLALIFAATALVSASVLAQGQDVAQEDPAASQPPPEMKALVESCAARKFETIVEVTVEGQKRGSKVKLCGQEGQSDADWAKTLKDAVKKVEANEEMAQAVKDQIVTAMNAEISKLETAKTVSIAPPVAIAPPAERPPEYAIYPPLPKAPAVAAKPPLAAPATALKKPRLTISCHTPGELGAGPCHSLERNTLLTIRADEDLAAGASLRFVRKGDFRGEVALTQMRQGQSLRSKLPSQLCAGVARSRVEIQILGRGAVASGAGQVLDTLGPYDLRCL